MTRHRCLGALLLATLLAPAAAAQTGYTPSPENLAARTWYQDAKFGLFIHWGASSTLQAGEWVMENRHIRVSEYEPVARMFDPTAFDAAAWVATAKAAGMKYITLITKHHDGFALWDSHVSDWTVVRRSPYGRDIVRQLADECHRQGIKLFVYYSQLDWHNPDYFPRGFTGRETGRPDSGNFDHYLDYMDAQLTELFSNYGELGGVWFDGMWDKDSAEWRLGRTYALIHRLQPQALIIANHHHLPNPGEDVQTFEQDLPGQNTSGLNVTDVSALPLETAATMNDSWGFNITDRNYKSTADIIRLLVNAAGRNANLLLNVGPRPTGEFPAEAVERLHAVGAWMQANGESIYGTRGGPVSPRPWGVTTRKGDRVYVHVLHWVDAELSLPALPGHVRSARILGGATIPFRETPEGVTLTLPTRGTDVVDQIAVLELR